MGLWQRPHVLGNTRELAERQIGSWISTIFRHEPPRLGLTRKQQRLLTTAMNGDTDAELAEELGVSVAAVKKSWRDIYDRVHDCIPGLFPSEGSYGQLDKERGKAKKHRLLSYVREHPQGTSPDYAKNHRPCCLILRRTPLPASQRLKTLRITRDAASRPVPPGEHRPEERSATSDEQEHLLRRDLL